jgi:hypothetical protein
MIVIIITIIKLTTNKHTSFTTTKMKIFSLKYEINKKWLIDIQIILDTIFFWLMDSKQIIYINAYLL